MLQQPEPEDYVIATGEQHSVREFVDAAAAAGGPCASRGRAAAPDEKGYDERGRRRIVAVDPRYFRPTEVDSLLGDASKARAKLGWTPRVRFAELVAEMMRADLKAAERDELLKKHGFAAPDSHE